MNKRDCIVIGGGIIGMTTARELAIRGLSVPLFDKGKPGRESSWAAGGILSPMRPATDNGKPYLGKLKDHENVYINTGHFRKGILQAPICARKIADMVC